MILLRALIQILPPHPVGAGEKGPAHNLKIGAQDADDQGVKTAQDDGEDQKLGGVIGQHPPAKEEQEGNQEPIPVGAEDGPPLFKPEPGSELILDHEMAAGNR